MTLRTLFHLRRIARGQFRYALTRELLHQARKQPRRSSRSKQT